MSLKKQILSVGVVAACAATVMLWQILSARSGAIETSDAKKDLNTLRSAGASQEEELAELRREMRSMRTRLQLVEGRSDEEWTRDWSEQEAIVESTPDVLSEEEEQQQLVQRREARRASIQEKFYYDAPNARWSGAMESAFRDATEKLNEVGLPGTRLLSATCKSTSCEVNFSHETPDEANRLLEEIHIDGLPRMTTFVEPDENGRTKTTLYAFSEEADI